MKSLYTALALFCVVAANCLSARAQDAFSYWPEGETAYCLRVFWRGHEAPARYLIGIRDKDKDYGPYKRLELVSAEGGRQSGKPVVLPASQSGVGGPDVLADFSPSGVLWFAKPSGNSIRINRVAGAEVTEREVQLGDGRDGELVLLSLRAPGETHILLIGQQRGDGVVVKLPGLEGDPKISQASSQIALADLRQFPKNEMILAGVRLGNAASKEFSLTTHLSKAGADLKNPTAQAAPVAGMPRDIAPVEPNFVAALTSTPVPGKLSLHLFTDALALVRSVTLFEGRSFTGTAFLMPYKGSVVVFISNHGKCSAVVVEPGTGRLVRTETIDTGQSRCVDIRAAASNGQLLLALTLWELQGNGFRAGVQARVRSLDGLVAGAR